MEPFSTAVVSKLAEAKIVEANAVKNAIDNNSVAPLGIVASTTLADIHIPTTELPTPPTAETSPVAIQRPEVGGVKEITNVEYAGLLNGMLDQEANLAGVGGEIGRYYDAAAEQTSALYDLGETKMTEFIEKSGLKEAVQLGLQDSIDWLEQTTGKDIFSDIEQLPDVAHPVLFYNPDHGITDATVKLETVGTDVTIAVAQKDLASLEQSFLKWCDEKGMLLTAKRVDFQVETEAGTDYVRGFATDVPLVGGLTNIACKSQLDVEVIAGDVEQVATDVINTGLVVTLVAAPFLLPAAAIPAGIGAFTMQSALVGATIGGVHGGLQNGAISVIRGTGAGEALVSTGKGMLGGAALGAIGGAVGGAVVFKAGASLMGLTGAGAASGAAAGGTFSGANELYSSGSISEALQAAGGGALAGGLVGGVLGAAGHTIGRVSSKIKPLPAFPEGLPQPTDIMVRTQVDRSVVNYGSMEIQPGMARHHIKPLSLGGMDNPSNIQMVPVAIHRQPHPPLEVRIAPVGTIFYSK